MPVLLRPRGQNGEASPVGTTGDDDLAARARYDPTAFELLYRRYVDPVHQYCHRRLGTREAAEDATSIVFTKAFTSLPSYRSRHADSFRCWLFAIAFHVITDQLRAQRPASSFEAAASVAGREATPEEAALAADAERSVSRLLAQLPVEQRHVVELRLAGLTGREVALVLRRSLPAVKIAQVRAYARLRDLLGSTSEPEEASHGRG